MRGVIMSSEGSVTGVESSLHMLDYFPRRRVQIVRNKKSKFCKDKCYTKLRLFLILPSFKTPFLHVRTSQETLHCVEI